MTSPPPSPSGGPLRTEGRVDPSQPGAPWWTYRRPRVTTLPAGSQTPRDVDPPASAPRPAPSRSSLLSPTLAPPSGVAGGLLVAALVVALVIGTRGFGYDSLGVVVFPLAGITAAIAFGRRCVRVHPDEPWLPRLLLLGTMAKLTASYLRYLTLTDAYGGVGDATRYDVDGRKFVAAWIGERATAPVLTDLRQTNFLRWLTGVVYYLFGQSLVAGFLLFGLLAVIGNYFWYRALAEALPRADKRLFLIFMMFAPSIAFWPSSLGKEALMQLGVGAMAWATALLLRGHVSRAVPLVLGGGWLLWVIRPHLLALVVVAAAIPYLVGHIRQRTPSGFVKRPIVMIVIAVAAVITVTSGLRYLGISTLSYDAIQSQLNDRTARSSYGGGSFTTGGSSLNPLTLPVGLVTVLFRPFLWEARSAFQLIAALESVAVIGLIVYRFDSVRGAIRRWRRDPFVLYCIVLLLSYAVAFSSFANFGLLSRQRSLVLPALYVLIAARPANLDTQGWDDDVPEPAPPGR